MTELPASFWQGVREFQQGRFYECHDTLEALWIEAQEPDKTFFQGILQIAVACYHLGNQNWRGAVILLGEGVRRLSPYQPEYANIDVNYLLDTSSDLLDQLRSIGPERIAEASASLRHQFSEPTPPATPLAIPTLRRSRVQP
ncbi:DUF309 domain-containing protein [Altericista sp. CCNU0014]|uniref:DUF309 domain-containing protein n=1 Tax=Altericista sp. CCNU0014 TaxID=3082949 RepID=UPI00384EB9EA